MLCGMSPLLPVRTRPTSLDCGLGCDAPRRDATRLDASRGAPWRVHGRALHQASRQASESHTCLRMVSYVVSGGQTGADTGALLAAEAVGMRTCGYMPRGYEREGGGGLRIAENYSLSEGTTGVLRSPLGVQHTGNAYKWRDMANVGLVDGLAGGVVAVRLSAPNTGKGTMQTMHYAREGAYDFCPDLYVRPSDDVDVQDVSGTYARVLCLWDPHQLEGDRRAAALASLVDWLNASSPASGLVVSGPLGSTAPGIEDAIANLLGDALRLHCEHAHEREGV